MPEIHESKYLKKEKKLWKVAFKKIQGVWSA